MCLLKHSLVFVNVMTLSSWEHSEVGARLINDKLEMPQRAWEDFSNCFVLRTRSFLGESTLVYMHHQTASIGELFLQGWGYLIYSCYLAVICTLPPNLCLISLHCKFGDACWPRTWNKPSQYKNVLRRNYEIVQVTGHSEDSCPCWLVTDHSEGSCPCWSGVFLSTSNTSVSQSPQ